MPDNTVTIFGNLADDPDLRFTSSGLAVCNFTVAVTPRVKEGDSWKQGEVSYFRCTAWRQTAENLAESMGKGQRVMVNGRLETKSWAGANGEKRTSTEIQVEDVGPSLRWQTAKTERANRPGGQEKSAAPTGSGSFNDDPPF